MLAAVKRKYGDRLWLEEVTPKTQLEIKKNHITLRQIARDIVLAGVTKDPSLWPKVDISQDKKTGGTLGSASKVVRDYIVGESWPTERVSDDRILFIEEFLGLPKKTLLAKVARKIDHNSLGRAQSEKSLAQINAVRFKHKEFSPDLQRVYNEYSAYKINGIQPEIVNIPDGLKNSRRFSLRAKVQEKSKRHVKWTKNALGQVGSQLSFKVELLGFQHFCVTQLNIPLEQVSSSHLTNPDVLMAMVTFSEGLKSGASAFVRILNFVKRGVDTQGYLRFCALKGERTDDEFYEDCDFILEEYRNWSEKAEEGINDRGGAEGQKGKLNIQFLLNKTPIERKQAVTNASKWLVNRADGYVLEAKRKRALIKADDSLAVQNRLAKNAATLIRKALQYTRTALIQQVSFYNAPRCSSFIELKYYETAKEQNKAFASLTFLRQRNRFELFIPKYGQSLVSDEPQVRFLKNADSKKAVDINIELPETLTPLIKKYLEIRDLYIEMDLMVFGGVTDKKSVEPLFPWRSVRANHVKSEKNNGLRERFLELSEKFSDNFKHLTYQAYFYTMPNEKQHGVNIHAMRHLVAETHLDENPGDFIGAAAKLNDEVEQIIATYGDKDRAKAMRRVSKTDDQDLVVI